MQPAIGRSADNDSKPSCKNKRNKKSADDSAVTSNLSCKPVARGLHLAEFIKAHRHARSRLTKHATDAHGDTETTCTGHSRVIQRTCREIQHGLVRSPQVR